MTLWVGTPITIEVVDNNRGRNRGHWLIGCQLWTDAREQSVTSYTSHTYWDAHLRGLNTLHGPSQQLPQIPSQEVMKNIRITPGSATHGVCSSAVIGSKKGLGHLTKLRAAFRLSLALGVPSSACVSLARENLSERSGNPGSPATDVENGTKTPQIHGDSWRFNQSTLEELWIQNDPNS